MASRLHKIGTIFSRTEALIRKGVIAESDPPVWFDVYYHFQPDYEPIFDRPAPNIEIKEIFYEEDLARAKIHNAFSKRLGAVNLSDTYKTNSQKWIKMYQDCVESKGMSESDALKFIEQEINKPTYQENTTLPKSVNTS